jgi:hypothetical protein
LVVEAEGRSDLDRGAGPGVRDLGTETEAGEEVLRLKVPRVISTGRTVVKERVPVLRTSTEAATDVAPVSSLPERTVFGLGAQNGPPA